MNTTNSAASKYFMDSEMWFVNSKQYWVEEGIFQGYESKISKSAYEIFFGWNTVNNSYNYTPIAYTTWNDSTTDSYQISHSSTPGIFNVWFDGQVYNTPNTGFLQSDLLELGAEVATPYGHAHTFNMYSSGIVGSQTQNWGTQTPTFKPTSIRGTVLNGVHYQNSEWSWNTVQP